MNPMNPMNPTNELTAPALDDRTTRAPSVALAAIAAVSLATSIVVPLPGPLLDLLIAASVIGALSLVADAARRDRVVEASRLVDRVTVTTLVRLVAVVAIGRAAIAGREPASLVAAIEHAVEIGGAIAAVALAAMLAVVHLAAVVPAIERVAEVTARFSLDGLPGAQLAIDADVRVGALSPFDARPARQAATSRAQSLGALDGAIKLARGEAIAALTVALFAGVAVAIRSPHGLARGATNAAVTTSSIVVVGLVPALLSAGAIAILLPRAARAEEAAAPSRSTWMLAMAAVAAIAAVVPGVPALPMLAVAVALVVGDAIEQRRRRAESIERRADDSATPLWSIAVGGAVAARIVAEPPFHAALQTHLRALHRDATARTGLPIAAPVIEHASPLAPNAIEARIRGTCVASVVADGPEALERLAATVRVSVGTRVADLVRGATIEQALTQLQKTDGPIARAFVPRPISLPMLLDVVRGLVAEGVVVADLGSVLEAVGRRAADTKEIALLVEAARIGLRRSITKTLVGDARSLVAIRVEPALEDVVRGALHRSPSGAKLALGPSARRDCIESVRAARATSDANVVAKVVIVSSDVRRFVREIVGEAMPDLAIVAPEELDREVVIDIVAVAAAPRTT